MKESTLNVIKDNLQTPAYYFDLDQFSEKAKYVKHFLKDIPLTFSIKANPFLLYNLPEEISYVEVCSPGELAICKEAKIPGSRIIYSGVNKDFCDIKEAIEYGVHYVTAESLKHVQIINEISYNSGLKTDIILRVTSGNQFGMSENDIEHVFENLNIFPGINICGIHYYSGTQKKIKKLISDVEYLDNFIHNLQIKFNFIPTIVEFGPGLAVDYFSNDFYDLEDDYIKQLCLLISKSKYSYGIELGRYLASDCGVYATRIDDIKNNNDINYVICDGGINHIKYYGQTMAMKIPNLTILGNANKKVRKKYCICGSLCTVADVLIRDVELNELQVDDVLLFERCGAYSVTENDALFLSRTMPKVFIYSKNYGILCVRNSFETYRLNYFFGNY